MTTAIIRQIATTADGTAFVVTCWCEQLGLSSVILFRDGEYIGGFKAMALARSKAQSLARGNLTWVTQCTGGISG
jgi:hypothetical protein